MILRREDIWRQDQGPRIAIVAGEASGDRLGAGLMDALETRLGSCSFAGAGGAAMQSRGLRPLVGFDRLQVNGITDPLVRLPELLGIQRRLGDAFAAHPPDVFVGVDFNVFNLRLARRMKRCGFPLVHYVSPSVYAWRRGRVRSLARSVDMLLTLFPFEAQFYQGQDLQVVYVGHPLADEIDDAASGEEARAQAKDQLQIGPGKCVAVLPGSRLSEVRHLAPAFFETARVVADKHGPVSFVVPCPTEPIRRWLAENAHLHAGLDLTSYAGDGRLALTACNAALVKSGTSTLEAMLLGRPMVVGYKLGGFNYQVLKRLVRTPYIALPNILAGEALVPEFIQDELQAQPMAKKISALLDKDTGYPEYLRSYAALRAELRRNANWRAADAVAGWLTDR